MTGGVVTVRVAELLALAYAWAAAATEEYDRAAHYGRDGDMERLARCMGRADADHCHATVLRRLCGQS